MNLVPRGIRNNNGGNLRRVGGMVWKGQEQTQTDPDFVQFVTAEYGIRAIVRILRSYKREGLNTIGKAISRWAPTSENNTAAYIKAVCDGCNIPASDHAPQDVVVDYDAIMPALVKAIILHENGQMPYSDDQISKGISLAAS
jgi:hypothetical protein